MNRQFRGQTAHLTGLAAEASIAAAYLHQGYDLAAQRWRGPGGEIDLIFRRDAAVVFVEVKAARRLEAAACQLSARQQARLSLSAEAFLDTEPRGSLTEARFDVALVDRSGMFEIIENAFGQG